MALILDPVVTIAAQALLTVVFALSALGKLRTWDAFAGTVANFRIVPAVAVRPIAYVLPPAELGVAIGLLFDPTRRHAAMMAVALLAIFSAAVVVNLARGRRRIDCGCFGTSSGQTLSWWLVARNGTLMLLATTLVAPVTAARPAHALDTVTGIAGAIGVVVLHLTLIQLRTTGLPGAGVSLRSKEAHSHD